MKRLKALKGRSYAGNPIVRLYGAEFASARPRRGASPCERRFGGSAAKAFCCLAAFALSLGAVRSAQASWGWSGAGANANWSTEANWDKHASDYGYYFRDSLVHIQSYTLNIDTLASLAAYDVYVDNGTSLSQPMVWTASSDANGITNSTKNLDVGLTDTDDGYLDIQRGTYYFNALQIGQAAADPKPLGWFKLGGSGNNVNMNVSGVYLQRGTLLVREGATINHSYFFSLGETAGATGLHMEIDGGTVNSKGKYLNVGSRSPATAVIKNGGTYNNTDGTGSIVIAGTSDGTLTIDDGGTVNLKGDVIFCYNSGAGAGVLNLKSGGILIAKDMLCSSSHATGTAEFNFDGGTFRAYSDHAEIIKADSRLTVTASANGGVIDTAGYALTITAGIGDAAGEAGKMKFVGGGSVALAGDIGWTGGTTIEAGTTVLVPDAAKAATLVGTGVPVTWPEDGVRYPGVCPLVTITGTDEFTDADVAMFLFAPGTVVPDGVTGPFLSEDKKSISLFIPASAGVGELAQDRAQLVFDGATLADLATHTLRARMRGNSLDDKGVEATFFNRQDTEENGVLTKVTYQLQVVDKAHIKCATVEFTAGECGVYAKLADGNFATYSGTFNTFGTVITSGAAVRGYMPYDLKLVKPVSNSINVNFTHTDGSNLDSSSSVRYGGGDYAVPYSAWSNMPAVASGNMAVGDATVSVTSSGQYKCCDLSKTNDLRYGYLDDTKGTVTVNVSGVPYEFYRVVAYAATDTADGQFGYMTINGVNYTGEPEATVEGTANWGHAGARNKAKGLREGVNYLVSKVTVGNPATVVGHRVSGSIRGCIAAVQVVEVAPSATYTATIDAEGDEDFFSLAWDDDLPDSLEGAKLVVNVEADATVNVDFPVTALGVEFNVASGTTLTLTGDAIAACAIAVNGEGQVVVGSGSQLAGIVKGDGTLVYDGFKPAGATFANAAWSGVLWVKNIPATSNERKDWALEELGSAGSTLRFTDVNLYFAYSTTTAFPGTVDLDGNGLNICDGYGGGKAVFARLTGDGTLSTGGGSQNGNALTINDVSGFEGSMQLTRYKVNIGTSNSTSASGVLVIDDGVTALVSDGQEWTAAGGIVVNGVLELGDGASVSAVTSGSGTVGVASGNTASVGGICGTVTFATEQDATLEVADASLTSLAFGLLDNQGTIDLTGTSITHVEFPLGEGETAPETGTILYPATLTDYVLVPADQSLRSLADFDVPEGLPAGATFIVQVSETNEEYGKGLATVSDVPEGASVRFVRPDGTVVDVAGADGVAELSTSARIDGAATAFDYTYTNTTSCAYRAPGWNVGWNADTTPMTFNNESADDTTGVYIKHHPWYTGVGTQIHDLDDFSLVVVGTMSPSANTIFIHMGTSTDLNDGILITTTGRPDEVLIAKNVGATVHADGGVNASVPNAATARHAYVINKKGTVFEVWVDGVKRGQFDAGEGYRLANGGIQVGSDHGGKIRDAGIYKGVPAEDTETGCLNVLRLYAYSLSAEQTQLVFDTYPFVSQGGLYTRTVSADGDFEATGAWVKSGDANAYDVPTGAMVDGVPYNPSATITAEADATLTVNADALIDTLTLGGSGELAFAADGAHTVSVKGAAVVNTPVTVEFGAVDMSGAPVQLGADGAIEFDCSAFDVSGIYATTRFQLTGLIDQDDSKVTFVAPAVVPHRSVTFGYSASGSCYEFYVIPDRDPGDVYYKSGTFAADYGDLVVVTLDGEQNETSTILFSGDNVLFDDSVAGENAVATFGATLPAGVTYGFTNWTGTVVLPAITSVGSGGLNLNDYGVAGSTVRVTEISGDAWLADAEVLPTVEIAEGGQLALGMFSATFANTIDKLTGSGSFSLLADSTAQGYQDGYFLVKDASGFTGSVTLAAPGLAIGAAKPADPVFYGQIVITTNVTVGAGAEWTAPNGVLLASADATLEVPDGATLTDGLNDTVPTTTVADCYVAVFSENNVTTYAVNEMFTLHLTTGDGVSAVSLSDGQRLTPGEVLTLTFSVESYYIWNVAIGGCYYEVNPNDSMSYTLTIDVADVDLTIETAREQVAVTVPEVTGAFVSRVEVSVGGVEDNNNGTYTVSAGTSVTIVWEAEEGYAIAEGTDTTQFFVEADCIVGTGGAGTLPTVTQVSTWPQGWSVTEAPSQAIQDAYTAWAATAGNDPTAANAEAAFLMGLNLADYEAPKVSALTVTADGSVTLTANWGLSNVNGRLYVLVGDSPETLDTTGVKQTVQPNAGGATVTVNPGGASAKFYRLGVDYGEPAE